MQNGKEVGGTTVPPVEVGAVVMPIALIFKQVRFSFTCRQCNATNEPLILGDIPNFIDCGLCKTKHKTLIA